MSDEEVKGLWVIDMRFFVRAEEDWKASTALLDRLPETDDVIYCYDPLAKVRPAKLSEVKKHCGGDGSDERKVE